MQILLRPEHAPLQPAKVEPPAAAPDALPGDAAVKAPEGPKGPTFAELGLHADVLRAIEEMGFSEPMPVQAATFPPITGGRATTAYFNPVSLVSMP